MCASWVVKQISLVNLNQVIGHDDLIHHYNSALKPPVFQSWPPKLLQYIRYAKVSTYNNHYKRICSFPLDRVEDINLRLCVGSILLQHTLQRIYHFLIASVFDCPGARGNISL